MALKQKSLSEIIANEIRHRIWNGEIDFGERLIESYLATEFDVSRSSLREAFQMLEFEGLVQNKARKGTFVVTFTEEDMKEISEARSILESTAFMNAVRRFSKEDYEHLIQIVEHMREYTQKADWTKVFDLDMEFHLYVVNLCNNTRIIRLYDIIQVQIRTLMSRLVPFYEKDPEMFYAEHLELVEALNSRDVTIIKETVIKHIRDSNSSMVDMFKIK